jgi:hypothetical protein
LLLHVLSTTHPHHLLLLFLLLLLPRGYATIAMCRPNIEPKLWRAQRLLVVMVVEEVVIC